MATRLRSITWKAIQLASALAAALIAACTQALNWTAAELAELHAYNGTWVVEGTLAYDNTAQVRNAKPRSTWMKQIWAIADGEISGSSRTGGDRQKVSGSIAPGGA